MNGVEGRRPLSLPSAPCPTGTMALKRNPLQVPCHLWGMRRWPVGGHAHEAAGSMQMTHSGRTLIRVIAFSRLRSAPENAVLIGRGLVCASHLAAVKARECVEAPSGVLRTWAATVSPAKGGGDLTNACFQDDPASRTAARVDRRRICR